ncbi:hypothetical protein JKP88DRAFT_295425 [Tribonema minus]|uniref:Uncharacterized protein n=1 Tax=Tribonema minus TaxID=303371 RepID=A0A836CQ57_9STRA|nr:hypothetical protein JKP88DRAFT_295425 [Tribonema minus]
MVSKFKKHRLEVSSHNPRSHGPGNSKALDRQAQLAVFRDRLWLTGGRSEAYQEYNLEYSQRRGDVWSSPDGRVWEQQTKLQGDFYVQNYDALDPGPLAPWWARFGHTLDTVRKYDALDPGSLAPWWARFRHTLDAIHATDMRGTEIEVLIQLGGYTPNPNNDQWLSIDGTVWKFAGHAPWSPRAWHATTKLNFAEHALWTPRAWHATTKLHVPMFMLCWDALEEKLLVLGGTPLVNDVWQLESVVQAPTGLWQLTWTPLTLAAPWSPRVGLGVSVLERSNGSTVFVTGGYAGWPRGSIQWDGERSRNDIWSSIDGRSWTLVASSAPWPPRAWHTLVTWSRDGTADVVVSAANTTITGTKSRMWLTGGGYIGTKGNNVVYKMISLTDMWWSSNGYNWYKVNYEEGSGDNAYSSMEWTLTEAEGKSVHLGRWGHQMVAWNDTVVAADGTTTQVPALYLIAGDTSGEGALANDVFVSNYTLLCSMGGIVCGNAGVCNGCTGSVRGNFCEVVADTESSAFALSGAWSVLRAGAAIASAAALSALLPLLLNGR